MRKGWNVQQKVQWTPAIRDNCHCGSCNGSTTITTTRMVFYWLLLLWSWLGATGIMVCLNVFLTMVYSYLLAFFSSSMYNRLHTLHPTCPTNLSLPAAAAATTLPSLQPTPWPPPWFSLMPDNEHSSIFFCRDWSRHFNLLLNFCCAIIEWS